MSYKRSIYELGRNPYNVFRLVRKIDIESTDVVVGRCMRGNDGTPYLNEKDSANLWKAHMSKVMNEDNELDQTADADVVQGPIERVLREEVMEAFKHLKIGKASGSSEVYSEMLLANGDVVIRVLMELCHYLLDGKGMPADWATSDVLAISKRKGYIMNCGIYRGVKLQENAMKIAEKVLDK